MEKFRFAIMGAGGIAVRFCRTVAAIDGVEIAAVASKSFERAENFVKNNCPEAKPYGSYKEMIDEVKPDAVYVATTPDSHYRLTKLCVDSGIPVLCEKAMFVTGREARELFALAEAKNVFTMEAMWSYFLPVNLKVKEWLDAGRIGKPVHMDIKIGFKANPDPEKRYFSHSLCGGASTDITVYTYELARYYIGKEIRSESITAVKAPTGVDASEVITLDYGDMTATLYSTLESSVDEYATIYGTDGRIVINHPHTTREAHLYTRDGEESVKDDGPDGFTYEILETVNCVRGGKTESGMVPHRLTIDCAELFDRIMESIGTERPDNTK